MGLFERLFGRAKQAEPERFGEYFKLLDGYAPYFRTWGGALYESELVRAAIDARARHISKLAVSIQGAAQPNLQRLMKKAPNEFSTWGQFLYRLSTILDVKNTAFVVPVIDKYGETTGVYPICPQDWELVEYKGEAFVRFKFASRDALAIELRRVGIMTKFQYKSDLFGETNGALRDTMELIQIQRQGIEESAKNAAHYKLLARVNNFTKPDDLAKERQRFDAENFQNGGGGILLLPNTYTDIRQLTQQSYSVDAEQLKVIKASVYDYFGVNEDVLQNAAYGDKFNAFYEGAIEPFAIQLSDVLTRMLFTLRERSQGSGIFLSANRLQYMTNTDKLNVSAQMMDRGIMTINEVREIWQLPPVENGDVRIIRGEYYGADDKITQQPAEEDSDA